MPVVAYNALVLRPPFSGVEKSVVELARALARRGAYDYRLLLPPACGAAAAGVDWPRLPVPSWSSGRAGRIGFELTLLPGCLRHAGIDLLHAPAYVAPPRLPCPLVLSLYDLHVYTHPRFCSAANRRHYRARLPGSIRRAAAILVPSRATRDALAARFPGAEARAHVIPLGVAPAYFEPGTPAALAAVRARYRLPARYLLFVGDPAPRKNLDGIRQAWQALRREHADLHLVRVGAGTLPPTLLAEGVHQTGYIDEADLPAVYALAEALVFPSFDEGFGLPVLEAMAAGCPVACAGGAAAEFAGEAVRYCDPDQPGSIADALRPLLDDAPFRARLVARGRQQAAAFTWDASAAATEAVYAQVLD